MSIKSDAEIYGATVVKNEKVTLRLKTFQAWKVVLIVCAVSILNSGIFSFAFILDELGTDVATGPESVAKLISEHLLKFAGSIAVIIPSVLVGVYAAKILLKLMNGIKVSIEP